MGLSNNIALRYAIISVIGFGKMEIAVVCATVHACSATTRLVVVDTSRFLHPAASQESHRIAWHHVSDAHLLIIF